MNRIYELKNARMGLVNEAQKALDGKNMETYKAKMGEVEAMNQEIYALESLEAEKGRFDEHDKAMLNLHDTIQQKKEETVTENKMNKARQGNEYVNAFVKAISNGIQPKNVYLHEDLKPLQNAMSIGGGTPAGSDGGFLVPVEFDNMIHRKMKEYVRLADYFNVETVNSYTGWRAVETSATRKALPEIEEAATITPDEQPKFAKVTYTLRKFGDRIAISNELLADNTAGLMQYLADWFGPKVVMTENTLLLGLLSALTAKQLTAGKEIAELKTALNKELNTAISRNAVLLCNQSSYDYLDQAVDSNGRPMLVPNPADPDVYRFKGRPVISGDEDIIPTRVVTTSGATKGDYYPIYIGHFRAFGTLFRRGALEFASTNIGGTAWTNDTTEVRGIVRMDAKTVDAAAAIMKEIFVAATGS